MHLIADVTFCMQNYGLGTEQISRHNFIVRSIAAVIECELQLLDWTRRGKPANFLCVNSGSFVCVCEACFSMRKLHKLHNTALIPRSPHEQSRTHTRTYAHRTRLTNKIIKEKYKSYICHMYSLNCSTRFLINRFSSLIGGVAQHRSISNSHISVDCGHCENTRGGVLRPTIKSNSDCR